MATIPHVVPDTITESAAQNALIDEVNNVCAKRTGATVTGTYSFTSSDPAIRLSRSGDAPFFDFYSEAGARLALVQATPSGLYLDVKAASGYVWRVNGAEVAALSSAGTLDLSGAIRTTGGAALGRTDDFSPLIIVDLNNPGAIGAGYAYIGFYPKGTSTSVPGTRGGYVGFNGEGFQLQADTGSITVQSVAADVGIEAATHIAMNPADALYVGKSAADPATVGTEIFTATHATSSVRGQVRNTVAVAGVENLYLRHVGAASASGQKFVTFQNAAGAEIGSIAQTATGITINGDTLIAELHAKIDALEAKVAALEAAR